MLFKLAWELCLHWLVWLNALDWLIHWPIQLESRYAKAPQKSLWNFAKSSQFLVFGQQVFAPSESALSGLDSNALCSTPDVLAQILSYHVAVEVLPSSQIPAGTSIVETLQGGYLKLVYSDAGSENASLSVNDGALAIAIDVGTNNGLIHVIDQVLTIPMTMWPTIPPTAPPTTGPTITPIPTAPLIYI